MKVTLDEITRYLRMGTASPDEALINRIELLLDNSYKIIRPTHIWRRFTISNGVIGTADQYIPITGTLSMHLKNCREAYLVCGTIGTSFDALLRKVSTISSSDLLILQAIGTALIEKWMDSTEYKIRKELAIGECITSRYSPGYGDFPLEAQHTILNLLDTPRKIGVSLTDTILMVPSKSVSAVIGVQRERSAIYAETSFGPQNIQTSTATAINGP